MLNSFLFNFWLWFLYLIIFILMLILNVSNVYFCIFYLLVSTTILCFKSDMFKGVFKIKYTSRMLRTIIVSFVLCFLIDCVFVLIFPFNFFCYLLPFVFLFDYWVLSCVLLLLLPLDLFTSKYYIAKSKKKLYAFNNLVKIGITGSFGKTSTKEILNTILSEKFYVLSTPKSFNTPLGISKTINDSLTEKHEVFICEMGAKRVNEIKYLCDYVKVDYGIVTAVGRQHTSTFGSVENIYKAKKELPDFLHNKTCVFNLMNSFVKKMYDDFDGNKLGVFCVLKHKIKINYSVLKKCKILKFKVLKNKIYYEFNKYLNVYAKNIVITDKGTLFDIYYGCCLISSTETVLLGIHNVINILLSVAMSLMLGLNFEQIRLGLSKIKQIHARMEKFITGNGAVVINNGYNSNIDSAKFSLGVLEFFDKKYKVVITPGLIESEDDYLYNKNLGQVISRYATDVVLVKNKNKNALYSGLLSSGFDMSRVKFVQSFSEAKKLFDYASSEYVILIENDLPDNYV